MEIVIRNGNKIIAFDNKAIYYYSNEEEYLKNSRFTIYGNFEDKVLVQLKKITSRILWGNNFEEVFLELLNQKKDNNAPLLENIKLLLIKILLISQQFQKKSKIQLQEEILTGKALKSMRTTSTAKAFHSSQNLNTRKWFGMKL